MYFIFYFQCVVKELPLPVKRQHRQSALKPVAAAAASAGGGTASGGDVSASGGGVTAGTSATAPVLVVALIGIDVADGMSNL
jgi:hypothetical protein